MAEHILTEAADNSRLSASVGDRIVVRLAESSAAGYVWESDALDSERFELVSRNYEPDESVGGAGVSVLTFAVKAHGQTRLDLRKVRPWESPRRAAQRFSVTITIAR